MASEKSPFPDPDIAASEGARAPPHGFQRGQVPTQMEEDEEAARGYLHYPPAAPEPAGARGPPGDDAAPPAYSTAPSPAPPTHLPTAARKPIALPSLTPTPTSPFLRAYPSVLASHNLSKESFLAFLDALNLAVSTSPPLQALDAAGGLLKAVPLLFPIRMVGSAVSGLAHLGEAGVARSRADRAVEKANKDVFGPRGLRVEIIRLDKLAHVAGIPILGAEGKIDKRAAARLLEGGAEALDVAERQLRAFAPWIAELEREGALPWTERSRLTRFNAAMRKREVGEKSEEEERAKVAGERGGKLRRAREAYEREVAEMERAEERSRARGMGGGEEAEVRRREAEERYRAVVEGIHEEYAGESLDEGWVKKTLWLVITDVGDESAVVR